MMKSDCCNACVRFIHAHYDYTPDTEENYEVWAFCSECKKPCGVKDEEKKDDG